MHLPELRAEDDPDFRPGQNVWIIDGKAVREVVVRSMIFELLLDKDAERIICTGYRLSEHNLHSDDWSFRPYEVYSSQKEAVLLARWYPVAGVSDEEWGLALGVRENDVTLETCELSRCCGNVSHARDILWECRERGGLIERDACEVKALLEGCDDKWLERDRPILRRVFDQLGFISQTPT